MVKINRAALRFGLSVASVALGTTMLGHLMPPKEPAPADPPVTVLPPVEAARQVLPNPAPAPAIRPTRVEAPVESAPVPSSRMVVENASSGGRVIILGRTATAPAVKAPASTVPQATTTLVVEAPPQPQVRPMPQPQPAPQVQPMPTVRSRRS